MPSVGRRAETATDLRDVSTGSPCLSAPTLESLRTLADLFYNMD